MGMRKMGSGDSPHVVGRRGQSPNGQFQRRAAGTVPEWAISTPGSGDSPRVVHVRPKFPLAAKPNEQRPEHST